MTELSDGLMQARRMRLKDLLHGDLHGFLWKDLQNEDTV